MGDPNEPVLWTGPSTDPVVEVRDLVASYDDQCVLNGVDMTSEGAWAGVVDGTVEAFGKLDVLVNNAGVLHMGSVEETTPADMERLWRINQLGPFLGMRAVTPALRENGRGSIVNISSVDGLTSKNGDHRLRRDEVGAARHDAGGGPRAREVRHPGQHGLPRGRAARECARPTSPKASTRCRPSPSPTRVIPYNRERDPIEIVRDIARMVLFLASDESLSCTGADYPVDAGWTAGKRDKFSPGA